jgi:peroxin-13
MGGPFDPNAPPPAPPTAWQAVLAGINGVMMFFGRLSFLVDENAHAVHFFISALLQLLDRAGSLYGEIARFILRVIFKRKRPPAQLGKGQLALPPGAPGAAEAAAAAGRLGFPGRPGAPAAAAAAGVRAGFGAAWAPPALPSSSMGAGDLPTGGHWENLWGDS